MDLFGFDEAAFDATPEDRQFGPKPDLGGSVAEADPLGGSVVLASRDDLGGSVVLLDDEVS